MSALTSSRTPSDFALTQERKAWSLSPIALKKPILCAEGTIWKKQRCLLDRTPVAVEIWLDFYNLFQKYSCVG